MHEIKFWISSRVFFQQKSMLVNWKQSLNVALEEHISYRFEKSYNLGNCRNKEKRIESTSSVAVI